MSYSGDAIGLVRAVLRQHCATDIAARNHLNEADRLGVDPLDYCAHRFGLGSTIVWQRAAGWAGFCFAAATPSKGQLPTVDRIEHLAGARTLRQRVLGEDLVFYAPKFAKVLSLAQAVSDNPQAARSVRFVPPEAIEAGLARVASAQLMDGARDQVAMLRPGSNARDLPASARIAFAVIVMVLIVLAIGAGVLAGPLLMPIMALLMTPPGLMRLAAALPHRDRNPTVTLLDDTELPVYSVLIPLRDEAAMVPSLRQAMAALDYPPEKLDIKFVVESKSPATVEAVERDLDDPRFRLVVVPEGPPNTKPKAINYALPLARGKYVVVYDAEDVPEPGQLRLAASRFETEPDLVCLQAELVPENARENLLTALFAGEYAGLFGRLLPALARWGLPVPLGGTSNHFRADVLRALGGWDAYNVTEDADLGVRLARGRLRAEMLASVTYEEAPLDLRAWMPQRTRWMKGWMQTLIAHNMTPWMFLHEAGPKAFLGFEILIGGMLVSSILHTVFIGALIGRVLLNGPADLIPDDIWDWLAALTLLIGSGGAMAIVFSGAIGQGDWRVVVVQLITPAYWVLHSIASVRALVELILAPGYWAKTTHGVTRVVRGPRTPEGAPRFRLRTG